MCLSFDTAPFKENYTNKESIYLLIVMMIILFGGSAQNNIACNISFISCGIRTINHQMIITRSSIYRNHNIVVMNMRRFLSGNIIRPVETEINSCFARTDGPALPMRMVIEITMYLYKTLT